MAYEERFGVRLVVNDQSQGPLKGFLANVKSVGQQAAHALMNPFHALASVQTFAFVQNVKEMGHAVEWALGKMERGQQFQEVFDVFQKLTRTPSEGRANSLAAQLQAAAGGAMDLSQTMTLANRALGTTKLSMDQIQTLFKYARQYSVGFGRDTAETFSRLSQGLIRGREGLLADVGILGNGIEGVKVTYERLRGAGTWDGLDPAAQHAEHIRQAMAEMQDKLSQGGGVIKMANGLDRIRTDITDIVDRMLAKPGDAVIDWLKHVAKITDGLKWMSAGDLWSKILKPIGGGALESLSRLFEKLGHDLGKGVLSSIAGMIGGLGGSAMAGFDYNTATAAADNVVSDVGPTSPLAHGLGFLGAAAAGIVKGTRKSAQAYNAAMTQPAPTDFTGYTPGPRRKAGEPFSPSQVSISEPWSWNPVANIMRDILLYTGSGWTDSDQKRAQWWRYNQMTGKASRSSAQERGFDPFPSLSSRVAGVISGGGAPSQASEAAGHSWDWSWVWDPTGKALSQTQQDAEQQRIGALADSIGRPTQRTPRANAAIQRQMIQRISRLAALKRMEAFGGTTPQIRKRAGADTAALRRLALQRHEIWSARDTATTFGRLSSRYTAEEMDALRAGIGESASSLGAGGIRSGLSDEALAGLGIAPSDWQRGPGRTLEGWESQRSDYLRATGKGGSMMGRAAPDRVMEGMQGTASKIGEGLNKFAAKLKDVDSAFAKALAGL